MHSERLRLIPVTITALVIIATAVVLYRPTPPSETASPTAAGDVAMYEAIVTDMVHGVPYYRAAGRELHERGYQTRSILGWRQPALYQGLAWGGVMVARGWLIACVVLLLMRSTQQLPFAATLALCHACLFVVASSSIYFSEVWAGVCIALSLLASLRGRHGLATLWGVVALLIRELAAPFCVAMTVIAWTNGRTRDVRRWLAAGVVYGVTYAAHVALSLQAMPEGARSHTHGWLYFGGPVFLVDALRFHGLLPLLPRVMTLAFVGALAVSAWSVRMPREFRIVGLVYAGFFTIAGQPFDGYWGAMAAPVLACWLPYVADGARQILRSDRSEPRLAT